MCSLQVRISSCCRSFLVRMLKPHHALSMFPAFLPSPSRSCLPMTFRDNLFSFFMLRWPSKPSLNQRLSRIYSIQLPPNQNTRRAREQQDAMRYEHWDVLAFPASDMPCAPLPEYSTKCVAIHDSALRAAASDESKHFWWQEKNDNPLTSRSRHHAIVDFFPSCSAARPAVPDLGAQLVGSSDIRL